MPASLVLAWSRGGQVSSAILYLAIVAIWAGFLVPAWIRRPHSARPGQEAGLTTDCESDTRLDVESTAEADLDGGIHVEVSRHIQVSRHEHATGHGQVDHHGSYFEGTMPGHGDTSANAGTIGAGAHAAGPGQDARAPGGTHAGGEAMEYRSGSQADAASAVGDADAAYHHAPPSLSRQQMLRARRRMLAILASLTFFALGLTALGKAGWWICVPPAGMLVLYTLLLREIALAEAEMAEKRRRRSLAARAARERAARHRSAQPAAASQPERNAQIIDISSRVGDQLYDQYADATVRAVGD